MNEVLYPDETAVTEKKWNPRFSAYAKAQGCTEAEVLRRDDWKYPGGRMTGFVLWMAEQRQLWQEVTGRRSLRDPGGQASFAAFIGREEASNDD